MIGENSSLNFGRSTNDTLDGVIEVEVAKGTLLKEMAILLKLDADILLKLNRKIKNGIVPKEKERYKITIPIEKVFAFYLRYEMPQTTKKIKPHLISHYVALGETLESIAKYYHANLEEIKQANHLENDYLILEQLLLIPVSKRIFENTLK
jgi:membrane-bound lytic murein transglycosylase D